MRPFSPRAAAAPSPAARNAPPSAAAAVVSPAPVPPSAPTPRRYDTWVRFTPPSPPHPRPSRRASPPKRARTSGLGESSNSRPQEPPSSPPQSPAPGSPQDLSLSSLIRRPTLYCGPIPGNADCSVQDLHDEIFYDISAFFALPELRDSMRLVHRYSLEPFMTPRQLFYPQVIVEFYQTITSRRDPNPTAIHFSIDGREGILRATDIAATFNLPVVLANSAEYRQWPHPSPREMVRLLSKDTTTRSILFRRQVPLSMLLIDHVLRSNNFPLQHLVQRRGAILDALYRISELFWFSLVELIMTSLFHFEDKDHRTNLSRVESIPFLFLRLLS